MSHTIICLLDKEYPPEHSFVDGMLASELAKVPSVHVILVVSRGKTERRVRRYGKAVCLPILYPRRRLGRILNFLIGWDMLRYLVKRQQLRRRRVSLFVRNDPILLLAAAFVRKRVNRLVFQSSFPHEELSSIWIKGAIAKMLYRMSSRAVDAVTAVSPLGLQRVRRLFPGVKDGCYIPLLADLQCVGPATRNGHDRNGVDRPVFVYIGTHNARRELDVVLKGVVRAIQRGAKGTFRFIGGSNREIAQLAAVPGVASLMRAGRIQFCSKVPRSRIPHLLAEADVGLSIIPPKPAYRELSPTKLAEYMGCGLAVLASRGIPLQEQFVEESGGGVLVDWDLEAIAEAIVQVSSKPDWIRDMQRRAKAYAEQHLRYSSYLAKFLYLFGEGG